MEVLALRVLEQHSQGPVQQGEPGTMPDFTSSLHELPLELMKKRSFYSCLFFVRVGFFGGFCFVCFCWWGFFVLLFVVSFCQSSKLSSALQL